MTFYKLELILGAIISTFGIIHLVILFIASQWLSLYIFIPLIFILGGIYLFYLSFKEVKPEKINVKDLSKNDLNSLKTELTKIGKKIDEKEDNLYKLEMKKAEIKVIICPVCKSNMNIKSEHNIFICQHCDTKFIVNWK